MMPDNEEMSWQKSSPKEEAKYKTSASQKKERSFEEMKADYASPPPVSIGVWLGIAGIILLLLLHHFSDDMSDSQITLSSQIIFSLISIGLFIATLVGFRRGRAMFGGYGVKRKDNPKMFWVGFATSLVVSVVVMFLVLQSIINPS